MSFDNCMFDATGKLVCGFSDCNWKPWSGLKSDYTVKCQKLGNDNRQPPLNNPMPYMNRADNRNTIGRYVECFSNNCGVVDNNFPKNTISPPYTVNDVLKQDNSGLKYLY